MDEDGVSNSTGPTPEMLPHHPRPVPTCQRPVRSDACLSQRVSNERMFSMFLLFEMKRNLGVSKFQSAPKIGKEEKAWLYPKKVETTGRLKVSFLPPFCNQRYRCCTACWRSSHFLCSAWNTCRPALQLNRTADFKYLIRRYNQLTLPPCIPRPPKTSILHLRPFPQKKAKRRVHQYIFSQNRMPPSHYTASLLLRWRSLLGSHHLRHPAIPHGRPSASNMSFKVHIGQKRLD